MKYKKSISSIISIIISIACLYFFYKEVDSFTVFFQQIQGAEYHYILISIILLCFTVFLEILGFTLSAIIFLFFAIILLSSLKNWKNALIISLSCSLMGYFIFIYIFNTQFPRGVFENFIERIQDGK